MCTFCGDEAETIEHTFWSCNKISELWYNLCTWIFEMTQIVLPLNLDIVLFGILNNKNQNYVRNKIVLLSKFHIFRTKLNEKSVNILSLKNYLKECLMIEKRISYNLTSLDIFNTYWSPWEPIFDN